MSNAGFSLVNYKIVRDNSTCLSTGNLDIAVVQVLSSRPEEIHFFLGNDVGLFL